MPENVVVPGLPIANKMGVQDQALGSSGEEYEYGMELAFLQLNGISDKCLPLPIGL
jgi:hypothetical protein